MFVQWKSVCCGMEISLCNANSLCNGNQFVQWKSVCAMMHNGLCHGNCATLQLDEQQHEAAFFFFSCLCAVCSVARVCTAVLSVTKQQVVVVSQLQLMHKSLCCSIHEWCEREHAKMHSKTDHNINSVMFYLLCHHSIISKCLGEDIGWVKMHTHIIHSLNFTWPYCTQ